MDRSRRSLLVVFMLIFLATAVSGAKIQGKVYDISLEEVNDVVVVIDTAPKQTYVVKEGFYTFQVPPGEYTLVASFMKDGELDSLAEETVTVTDEGVYVIDMITFPEIGLGAFDDIDDTFAAVEDDLDDIELLPADPAEVPGGFDYRNILYGILGGLVVYFGYYFWKRRPLPADLPPDIRKVLKFIRKESGRTTQKEIRKHMGISEAKASLLVSEMIGNGFVKKYKKGRGNIIVLRKKK